VITAMQRVKKAAHSAAVLKAYADQSSASPTAAPKTWADGSERS
jgi:hypothetical protein